MNRNPENTPNRTKRYCVSIAIDARVFVTADADSSEEAREEAMKEFMCSRLTDYAVEVIDAQPVNAEDEDGNITDFD